MKKIKEPTTVAWPWYSLALALFTVVIGWLFLSAIWRWMYQDLEFHQSTMLWNMWLAIAAVISLVIAWWRNRMAWKQAETSERGLLSNNLQTLEEGKNTNDESTMISIIADVLAFLLCLGMSVLIVEAMLSYYNVTVSKKLFIDVRDLLLLYLAFPVLLLAYMRSYSAWRQAQAAQKQAGTALRQAETALQQAKTSEIRLFNERYQKGVDMLGDEYLVTRIGGVHLLSMLMEERPLELHPEIISTLCAFCQYPTKSRASRDKDVDNIVRNKRGCLPDVEAAICAVAARKNLLRKNNQFKIDDLTILDFEGADLAYVLVNQTNLRGAIFVHADLTGAILKDTDLTDANFGVADLTDADLTGADITNAILARATLKDTIGLTQKMLNSTRPSSRPDTYPLPGGLIWPHERHEDDTWHRKPGYDVEE